MTRHEDQLHNAIAAAVSAGISAATVAPLDTLKIRWQVSQKCEQLTLLSFARGIVSRDGLTYGLLLPGLSMNVAAIAASSALRFPLYGIIRDTLSSEKSAITMTIAGFGAGVAAYWMTAPLWLAKTVGQAQAELAPAENRLSSRQVMSRLWSEGGIRRMFRGSGALVMRGTCLSTGNLLGYDGTKTLAQRYHIMNDGPALHMIAAIVSAGVGTTLAAPADVIMAYVHSARLRRGHAFKDVRRCIHDLIRDHGIRGLWRGCAVFFATKTPSFVINLMIYEQMRRMLGLEYFD